MTDHPDAQTLDLMVEWSDCPHGTKEAVRRGAAAIRALQGLRPHHPRAVVGNSYATLVVGYDELVAAQDAIGIENDLGRFDLEAAQDKHRAERLARYRGMDAGDIEAKWGR